MTISFTRKMLKATCRVNFVLLNLEESISKKFHKTWHTFLVSKFLVKHISVNKKILSVICNFICPGNCKRSCWITLKV